MPAPIGDDDDLDLEAGASSSAAGGGGGGGGGEGGSEGGGSWAPEEYEEDEVRGVEPGYLKFQQRLMRQPDQCVR